MGLQRTHIVFPQELLEEIDREVGPRGRSAFLMELAKAELRKRQLLAFLRDPEPVMKDEDHPEFADGTQVWVRKLRDEGEARLRRIEERDERLSGSSTGHNGPD